MSGIDFRTHAQRVLDRSPTPPQYLPPDDPMRVVYELMNGDRDELDLEEEVGGLEAEVSDLERQVAGYKETADLVDEIIADLADAAPAITELSEAVKRLEAYKSMRPHPGGAPHADDAAVDRFAAALKAKLSAARAKGRCGWQNAEPGMQQRLSDMLRAHVEKGDPRDVANFAMFLFCRGESILPEAPK